MHLAQDLDVLDAVGAEIPPPLGVVTGPAASAGECRGGRLGLGESVNKRGACGVFVLTFERLRE